MKDGLKQNMGTLDRVLRVSAGIVLLLLAVSVSAGTTATVLSILCLPLLIPGITGYCPTYTLLGISTKRKGALEAKQLISKGDTR